MSVAGAEPVLQVAIASKWYRPARAEPVEAVRNLTFGVAAGEIVCLIGPSGAGKTTTLRILLGLDTAFEGRVSGADRAERHPAAPASRSATRRCSVPVCDIPAKKATAALREGAAGATEAPRRSRNADETDPDCNAAPPCRQDRLSACQHSSPS